MRKAFVILMSMFLLMLLPSTAFAAIESLSLSNYRQASTPEYIINYRVDRSGLYTASNDYISLFSNRQV